MNKKINLLLVLAASLLVNNTVFCMEKKVKCRNFTGKKEDYDYKYISLAVDYASHHPEKTNNKVYWDNFTNLKGVTFSSKHLKDETINHIARTHNIERIEFLDYDTIGKIKPGNWKHLKNLSIPHSSNVSDTLVDKIGKTCPNIEMLDIHYCENFTGKDVDWKNFPNLKTIIAFHSGICTEAIANIAKNCPIEVLIVCDCKNIIWEDINEDDWENNFQYLKVLDISTYNDDVVNKIAKHCKNIEKIDFTNHIYEKKFTGKTVKWIKFEKLKYINLWATLVDDEVVTNILESCHKLEEIHVRSPNFKGNVDWTKVKKLKKALGIIGNKKFHVDGNYKVTTRPYKPFKD